MLKRFVIDNMLHYYYSSGSMGAIRR